MKVIETGFGDAHEAFLETRFSDRVNIVFSDDNNKGKTILLQGLMYALGNEPIFPAGFDHRDYYFYTKCEFDGKTWSFLRKCTSIVVLFDGEITVFDSISEFKYFFNERISRIPAIIKDNQKKLADPELLYQLFFLPQDNRDPSALISSGYYKKADFIQMILSIAGIGSITIDHGSVDRIKEEIHELQEKQRIKQKQLKFAKTHPVLSAITAKTQDRAAAEKKRKAIEGINQQISDLRKERAREYNRKSKLEALLGELNSLNRDLEVGQVVCADCGSARVLFRKGDLAFDVSNTFVRRQVIGSIQEQIRLKDEIVAEKDRQIKAEQDQLTRELQHTHPTIQAILLHAEEILSSTEIDNELEALQTELGNLQGKLNELRSASANSDSAAQDLINRVLTVMNRTYHEVDPAGKLVFGDIFARKNQTYSGSEGQEFYFAKLIALNEVLGHEFPIIIDSFRGGELATEKERLMTNTFIGLKKQVILTSTLKSEEYSSEKYSGLPAVTALDYSTNRSSHILSSSFAPDFRRICAQFQITAF